MVAVVMMVVTMVMIGGDGGGDGRSQSRCTKSAQQGPQSTAPATKMSRPTK